MAKRLITIRGRQGKIEKVIEKDWINDIEDSKEYNDMLKAAIAIGLIPENYKMNIVADGFQIEAFTWDFGE